MKCRIGFIALLLIAQAGAQTTPSTPVEMTAIASKEQYVVCLNDADKLKNDRVTLRARTDEHNGRMKSVLEERAAHAASMATVDPAKEDAVNGFNRRVQEINGKVEGLNKIAEGLRKELAEYNAATEAHAKRCTQLQVKPEVKETVDRERSVRAK